MRRTALAATVAVGVLALSACGGSSDASSTVASDCTPAVEGVELKNPGKLTASFQEYPPYISNKGGTLSGVDGEVLKRVASSLCLTVDAKVTSPTAIIESVKNGSADLTAGNWYINEERASLFELSDPVYADQTAVISKDDLKTVDDLQGKTVGTVQGYLWVEDLQEAVGTENVKLYNSEDAVYQDVSAGRLQAGVTTFGGATAAAATNKGTLKIENMEPDERIAATIGVPRTAVLIHKGDTKLAQAVNMVIQEMHQDGSLVKALEDNGLPATAADVQDAAATATASATS